MKALIQAVLLACTLTVPALSFAQSVQGPVTRAEVRADLIRLEQAGYSPHGDDANYPQDLQAAEAKVAAETGSASTGTPMHAQAQGQARLHASLGTPAIDQVRNAFQFGA
ncbi:DUF4148 domain-containing protein [Cupriavidus sp. 2TAF22]|uniref:DUF4148 domain-containing protein n=1 Tax=unclassified Cupriavidus TaxID=2640874 RepID=UPI003F8EE9F3